MRGTFQCSALTVRKLDSSLAEVTRNFDATKYERVLQGYRLTGNSAKVLEKLQRLFIETIQSNTQDAVYAHVVMSADNAEELKQYVPRGGWIRVDEGGVGGWGGWM